MTILVTGATGFLGGHLVDRLVSARHRVMAYVQPSSASYRRSDIEWFTLQPGSEKEPFLRDSIHAIIHMATCYGRAGESIPSLLQTNVFLPAQLAHLAAQFNASLFINTDTYFNQGDEGISLLPNYSLSKHQALHWLKRSTAETGMTLVNMRLEHVYGPGDRPEKFCPSVLRAMARHETELPMTSGEQRRDFIYIDDVVDAFSTVLSGWKGRAGGNIEFGVGWGTSLPIREFVTTGHRLAGSRTNLLFGALPTRAADFADSRADNRSLRELGWKPRVDLATGIQRTLDSYTVPLPR